MNIYDEAINSMLNEEKGYQGRIEKLLDRAKKVEELLYWYRESWKTMRDGCLESKINKLEKELEMKGNDTERSIKKIAF